MNIKINYDATTGEIKGFYPDSIKYKTIPEPYIEIDEKQHMDCINNQGLRKIDIDNKKIISCDAPKPTNDQLLANLRAKRDELLQQSDFTQLPDVQLSDDKKKEWQVYRQALRDLPEKCTDLINPTFPELPK